MLTTCLLVIDIEFDFERNANDEFEISCQNLSETFFSLRIPVVGAGTPRARARPIRIRARS